MNRRLALIALTLPAFHCAEEGDFDASAEALPAGELAPPIAMDLAYDHDLFRGRPTVVTVTGAPANRTVYLLASTNTAGPGICPPPLNPDCLDIANPYVMLGQRAADAQGNVTFTINVPANLTAPAVEIQAASVSGASHYISDARVLDVMDPPTATTIPNLRSGAAPVGSFVEITGVVTAVRSNGFTMQTTGAMNAAIWVYTSSLREPPVGDTVKAAGNFQPFDNNGTETSAAGTLAELDVFGAAGGYVASTGTAPLPTPTRATLANLNDPAWLESHECMLVNLDEAFPLVITTDPNDPAQFGEFHVGQSLGGAVQGEVDNEFFNFVTATPGIAMGDTIDSVRGVLFFSFDEYKVAPTAATDVVGYMPGVP